MFYSDGTVKVERHTLYKEGYTPIKIRKILGVWETLAYTNSRLDDRWEVIDSNKYCEDCIKNTLNYMEKKNEPKL